MSWTQQNNQISGFVVEKKAEVGTYSQLAKPESNKLTVADRNVEGGIKYGYQLYSYAGSNNSNYVSAEITPVLTAIITTISATNITPISAVMGGNVTSDGGSLIADFGVCFSTSPSSKISSTKVVIGNGIGSFSKLVFGLMQNTKYYFRAYATNVTGTAYGNEQIFTTPGVPVKITTHPVSSIMATSAICGGMITDDAGFNHK